MKENPTGQDRFLILLLVAVLALSVMWLSERNGETKLADLVPAAWKPGKAPEPVPAQGPVLDLQDSFARVAETIKPVVVSITATHVETVQAVPHQFYFGDPFEDFFREFQGLPPRGGTAPAPRQFERRQQGMGSGVVVDARGYILTNEHVVRGADELTVTFQLPQEKKFVGKIVGADPRSDLAVVKIDAPGDLAYAGLADSDKVRVGDWAIAIGSPFGLEQTVTVGVISAVRQSLNIEGLNYSGLLQTDAAINRGNSGGPLVNVRGEVIGINTAIYAPTGVFSGIGFAIPANRVKDILEQLIEKGRVVRGWMGVEILSVNEVIARQFNLPQAEGVMINNVLPDSPAGKAGLKRGDVVVRFNGKPTPTQEILVDLVGKTPPKTTVKVGLIRDGKAMELSLVTAEMPKEPGPASAPEEPAADEAKPLEWEGARLGNLTPSLSSRLGLPEGAAGVVVLAPPTGGLAEQLGLEEGDVIASLNRQKTPDVKAFEKAARKASAKEGVLLDINRRGRNLYLSYRAGQ